MKISKGISKLLLVAAMLFTVNAYATDPGWDFDGPKAEKWHGFKVAEIYAHTWTRHSRHNNRLNDYNRGGGVRLENNIIIGTYYNSIFQNSVYVGYAYDVNDYFGFVSGFITGYCKEKVPLPFGTAVFTIPVNKIKPLIRWIPEAKHLRVHLNVIPAPQQSIANLTFGWRF